MKWVKVFDSGGGAASTWAANVPGGVVIESVYVDENDDATAIAMVFVPGASVAELGPDTGDEADE